MTFKGPFILYEGIPGTAPANCPPEYPNAIGTYFAGLIPENAQCSACGCQLPDVKCAFSDKIDGYSIAIGCNGGAVGVNQSLACGPIIVPGGIPPSSWSAPAPQASAGNCPPTGGVPTIPPPNWTTEAVLCGGPATMSGGCGNDVCVPRAPAPYLPTICVFEQGQHNCPNLYPVQHIYETGAVNDTRDCTKCSCMSPGKPDCKADTQIWDAPNCMTQNPQKYPIDVPNDGNCYAAPGGASLQVTTKVTNNPGCLPDPAGGQPTGSITSANQFVTVCCQ